MEEVITDTLTEVERLNRDLLNAGIVTDFKHDEEANAAEIHWTSKNGPVGIYICLSERDVVIQAETGSSYGMSIAQAKENIFNSYL